MRKPLFRDRRQAGRQLAGRLARFAGQDALVLALPRGGVPVAFEVAQALGGELDVFVARKLGVPGHQELAYGAIAGDVTVVDEQTVTGMALDRKAMRAVEDLERQEMARRTRLYRGDRPGLQIARRTVIVVDDGVATGNTARAALGCLRREGPKRLVFGAPVGPPTAQVDLTDIADQVDLVHTPRSLGAVGDWYEDFGQTSDDEVLAFLAASRRAAPVPAASAS